MRIFILCMMVSAILCTFPKDFKFGTATAAFQVEGAWLDDNKAPSVWDNLAHLPNYTADGRAPDIASDSYHRYKEDIALMVQAGIKHYRFSISWPRIVPKGRAGSPINDKAVQHYREMILALQEAGITPYVTLYHWDLPVVLAIQGYGLVDKYFRADFLYYAKTCFDKFGDLVTYWFTFNEPWCIALLNDFKKRDVGKKPYDIAHNVLLAHADTVKLYRESYKEAQKGVIGMVFNSDMFWAKDPNNPEHVEAQKRAMDFFLGWFADPIFKGDYPEVMKQRVKERLPVFTEEQKQLLKGSSDFFALNHYSSSLVEPDNIKEGTNYWEDRNIITSAKPEWKKTDMGWSIVPEGMHDLLVEIHNRYLKGTEMPLFITENGMANKEDNVDQAKNDQPRIDYLSAYLQNIEKAIDEEKVNVKGYFVWSLLDNFEWREGFSKRFGMVRIEFTDNPTRMAKSSLNWYRDFIKSHSQ